jgi:hypothetical protein
MTLGEIIDQLGSPTSVWENAMGRTANENSYYLYEIHHLSMGLWENQVWIFNSLEEFGDFTYALELFNYIYDSEKTDYDEELDDEFYQRLKKNRESTWDWEKCQLFIKNRENSEISIKALGRVKALLETTQSDFEKSKKYYSSIDELEKINLDEATYQILNKYAEISKVAPCDSKEEFLEFISNWE